MKSGDGAVTTGGSYSTGAAGTDQVQVEDSSGNVAFATVVVAPVEPLRISPATVSILTGQDLTFSASGGVPPYTYRLISGSGGMSGATYTAATPGIAKVRVTDSLTNADEATVTVQAIPPLTILPSAATILEGGTIDFAATGGTPPYTFSMKSGDGEVTTSGAYKAGAAGTDEVQVEDDGGITVVANIVVQAVPELTISPSAITLLDGDETTFTASGGSPPYAFTVVAPGPGTIDGNGLYKTSGTGSALVRVTDQNDDRRDAVVTIVSLGPLALSPSNVTLAVSGTTQFTASGGKPPYSFTVTSGGGSLSPVGSTAVEYTAPNTPDSATIEVRDALNNTVEAIASVLGLSCGQTLAETEPNDDDAPPWTEVSDLGIVLVSGCQVEITGTSDADSASDTFKISTGSASYVSLVVQWQTGSKVFDIYIRRPDGSVAASATTGGTQSESLAWIVGEENSDRYIELAVTGTTGSAYTLTISAF
jgi:hypothetical protein